MGQVIGGVFIAVAWTLGIWQTARDVKHDRQFSHICARPSGSMVAYCLPKDGCWLLDATGAPACYRVATLINPVKE